MRATKSRKASQASVIFWWPVNRPVSRITRRSIRSRVLDREAQPDRPAPVVHHHRRAAQVEILEQRRRQRDVAVVGVPADVGRLVRAAEAGEVGRHAAKAGVAHGRDHLAPQKRPRRLAVHEDHRRALALVEVGQAQAVHLAVVRLEGEVGQPSSASSGVRTASVISPRSISCALIG